LRLTTDDYAYYGRNVKLRHLVVASETAGSTPLERYGRPLGDVVFSNNTVLGDGVNVASRIHALAPPGGICVSANV
jgi:class 3 adenylate cyclase